jgi:hypothetical protein
MAFDIVAVESLRKEAMTVPESVVELYDPVMVRVTGEVLVRRALIESRKSPGDEPDQISFPSRNRDG